ncbi:MAG: magnesium/cobalt transporter CorA [Candidatus Eisenbacteria bacterium]|nr:magnesium/cobalt transporter CorA [Candidatus Eisenbacteria bacterium]
MSRLFRRTAERAALSPGTVAYLGEKKVERVRIRTIRYDKERFDENDEATLEGALAEAGGAGILWIDVIGLHDTAVLGAIGERYGIHPLVLEDIVNTGQRPKMEDHGDYIYAVFRMFSLDEGESRLGSEQVSLLLGPNWVISFQEREGDVFGPVRERLRRGKGRSRSLGADYLAYALLDAAVDAYFVVLEVFGERIEEIEERLVENPDPETLQSIHELKREMILLRRATFPLRELASAMERTETKLVRKTTGIFLRDLYDHTVQVADGVESLRDILSGLQDLYLSSMSNRMNEVMKVLTIAATIFVPLTFVAGIYGMNFEHMPELGWRWSYPIFWVAVILLGGGMFAWFRRKRWI